jgi:hypothetical protein
VNNAGIQPTLAVPVALAVSLLVLSVGAWLVLGCWYPQSFWRASGVLNIAAYALWAHLGITALLFLPWRNRSKAPESLRSDVALLVFLILSSSLFSLSFLFAGRPVALVFAVDRVALVRANEIRTMELAFAESLSKNLRVSGPLKLIAARQSNDAERLDSIQLAMAGFDLHQRPGFWTDIDSQQNQFKQKAQGIDGLGGPNGGPLAGLEQVHAKWAFFLPLAGARGNWALVLDDELKTFAPFEID